MLYSWALLRARGACLCACVVCAVCVCVCVRCACVTKSVCVCVCVVLCTECWYPWNYCNDNNISFITLHSRDHTLYLAMYLSIHVSTERMRPNTICSIYLLFYIIWGHPKSSFHQAVQCLQLWTACVHRKTWEVPNYFLKF